ncbi:MAG TPA: phosphatidylglycerophosphatase A [Terriglobales bacterium]|jgi:phosphatidylglycerophosphatase A
MENLTPAASQSQPAPLWATLTATFFYIGKLKPGPGTWGSATTVLLWFGLSHWIAPHSQPFVAIVLSVAVILIGIPAATRAAHAYGKKDPSFVVIDEVAGQLITLIYASVTWKSLLIAFILFRGFDIFKPPPIRQLERLPEGTGIVLDDVGAGLMALAVMQLLIHYSILAR